MSLQETPSVSVAQTESFVRPVAPSSNLILGVVVGAAAAVAGAIAWATIAYVTGMIIGYIAIGVGFLVGLAIRRFGRGSSQIFGIAGGALALAGCVLGDLFTTVAMISKEAGTPMLEVFKLLPSDAVVTIITEQDPMGWIIYGIAVFAGFKYSIVPAAAASQEQPATS